MAVSKWHLQYKFDTNIIYPCTLRVHPISFEYNIIYYPVLYGYSTGYKNVCLN